MANEDYLKRKGVDVLWNADKVIDIDKVAEEAWFKKLYPTKEEQDKIKNRFHNLENRRTIADKYQRGNMLGYVEELLNNSDVPNDFKQSLQKTKENLNRIDSYRDKEGLAQYIKDNKKDKKAIADAKNLYNRMTQYYNGRPENFAVRAADAVDRWTKTLGEHKEKPLIIKSTSPDEPSRFSGKNAVLNAFNKIGREAVEGTVGVGTDVLRKLGGAPLEHLKSTAGFTGPLAVSLLTSAFIPNPYIDKKAKALQNILNPLQIYADDIPEGSNVNALFDRYPTFTNAFLNQEIEDPRITDKKGRVTLQDIVDSDAGTPYLNKFKADVYPFLQFVDNKLADLNYSEAERDQFLSALPPEVIKNYLNKDIYGLRSLEEQQAALDGYLNNKGADDETREAHQKVLNDYFKHFDPEIGLAPALFTQKGANDYAVTPYMQALIDYTDANNDSGSAFTGGFGQGAGAGGLAGLLAGFAVGNKGKKLKNAAAKALEGFFVGGTAAGALDAARAATFDDDVLSKALPELYQAPAFSSFLANLGNFRDNSAEPVSNAFRLKSWQDRVNWEAPQANDNIIQIDPNLLEPGSW